MATLSKSKFTSFIQCPKKMWMEIYHPENTVIDEYTQAVLNRGIELGRLAQNLFHGAVSSEVFFTDGTQDLSNMIRLTRSMLDGSKPLPPYITEAAFSFEDCYCAVDILKVINQTTVEIYEVKSSAHHPGDEKSEQKKKDIYLPDVAYQTWVLRSLGYTVQKVNIVLLNADYTLPASLELDIHELFTEIDITAEVAMYLTSDFAKKIHDAKYITDMETEPRYTLSLQCRKPYECPFTEFCMKQAGVPENSVFDLYRATWKKKIEYWSKNIRTFDDVKSEITADTQKMQVSCTLENREHVNVEGIRLWLDRLVYPLYFLDFESIQPTLPIYEGTHPYQQIPTQYSLHIKQTADSPELTHTDYLGDPNSDPRRPLAEKMIADLGTSGSIVVYNKTFEMTRIAELAEMYPDLSEALLNINHRIVDLLEPFSKGYYYVPAMKDSFSIKSVLPALYPDSEELNYHNLNEAVQNGAMAMNVYPMMRTMNEAQVAETRKALLEYCKLDTLAMVRVMDKLYEKI